MPGSWRKEKGTRLPVTYLLTTTTSSSFVSRFFTFLFLLFLPSSFSKLTSDHHFNYQTNYCLGAGEYTSLVKCICHSEVLKSGYMFSLQATSNSCNRHTCFSCQILLFLAVMTASMILHNSKLWIALTADKRKENFVFLPKRSLKAYCFKPTAIECSGLASSERHN